MNPLIRTGRRVGVWRLVAVAVLPIAVVALLLSALWNPTERLDTVRAAIVNLDEPVTVDGRLVPLGRQLAAGLVSGTAPSTEQSVKAAPASDASYDWEITSAEVARSGLEDGTYAAVITIPADFSAAATSFGGDDPAKARRATIDVATPPGGRVADNVLARVVASTATSVMGSTLTETYVDNVLVGFNTLADQLGQAADGANQLADGATSASEGATQLADGASQLATGASSASGGASQLADGASQLASGASSASSGANQLADGARQAANGAGDLATGASSLADGAGQLAGGAGRLADGIGTSQAGADQLAAGAGELAGSLEASAGGAAQAAQGVAQIAQAARDCPVLAAAICLDQIADQLEKVAGTPGDAPTDGSLYALANGLGVAAGDQGAGKLASGAQELAGGLGQLKAGADELTGGATGLQSGASQLASGATALQGGVGQVADGASSLATGVGQLATGAQGLKSGAGELSSGVGQLATGADGLATGAGGLADGVGKLAGGAGELAGGLGKATEQIPTYSDGDRATLASVVANPVAAPSDTTLDTGTTGPLFAVVALWLGALALTTAVRPSRSRALYATRGAARVALEDLALPAAIAAGTGAVVGAVLAGVEGLSPLGWIGAIALGALVSVVFVAVHQGFSLLIGDYARAVSLLMAVLIIATGVIATVPGWIDGLADTLAIGAARRALVGLVVPGAGGIAAAVTGLVVWGLAGVALAVLATGRSRTTRVSRLLATG